jgi:glycolate oxidase iron-sulfur subunit
MQVTLATRFTNRADAGEAVDILRRCVHCGFCTATCPTYQLFGDELDGPRGRLYLVKQLLEGETPTARTRLHLDRCLTCRACESTCPSGVAYGPLVDIGRAVLADELPRGPMAKLGRAALATFLTGPFFRPAVALGRLFRPLLPANLRRALRVPAAHLPAAVRTPVHARRVLLLAGCVQPALSPNIQAATTRVLGALGIQTLLPPSAGCCGAIRHHLDEQAAALHDMRRNIDAWWPAIEAGAEAIVVNASGCGTMLQDYGRLLRDDRAYADKAARVSALVRDLSEVVAAESAQLTALRAQSESQGASRAPSRVVFHPPCSLQHGMKIRGVVESILTAAGATLLPFADSHLCCGSAGTYSLLQRKTSGELRDRKLAAIAAVKPDLILSANIGCITQLGEEGGFPVRHWIEWLADRVC